jgi:hypothetical protein
VDRSRKGSASSTQRRRWSRNLRLFLPLPLSFSFFLPPPFFPWFAGSRGAGGAAKSGKRASPCAEPLRIEGHGWAPSPARGSAVSLEEGEGARSLRVRSYQR